MSLHSGRPDHIPEAAPVAVIGTGCRLPGAHGPEQLWELLRSGRDATGAAPASRFPVGTVLPRGGERGGFVDGVDEFDAEFFGVPAVEAEAMDPQQRLLLHTAWEGPGRCRSTRRCGPPTTANPSTRSSCANSVP
ncbi:hypothetical protein STENM327S_02462 [Streptomyces tendae]